MKAAYALMVLFLTFSIVHATSNTMTQTVELIGMPGGLSGSFQTASYEAYDYGAGCTICFVSANTYLFTTTNGVTYITIPNMTRNFSTSSIQITGFSTTQSSGGNQYLACTSNYKTQCFNYTNPTVLKWGNTTVIKYWNSLNMSAYNATEAADLEAMGISANSPIIVGLIGYPKNTVTFGTPINGNVLNASMVASYATYNSVNGSLNFVTTNVVPAIDKLPIKGTYGNNSYTYVNSGLNGSANVIISPYVRTANGLAYSKNAMNVTVLLSANALNKLKYTYTLTTPSGTTSGNYTTNSLSLLLNPISLLPGQSATVKFDTQGNNNYHPIDPTVTYTVANSNYNVQGTQTLGSDLVVGNLTINGGNTLNTNGYDVFVAGTFNGIGGTIKTGILNNGAPGGWLSAGGSTLVAGGTAGTSGGCSASVTVGNVPNSYGGSGGGGSGGGCSGGGAGSTPSAPTMSNANIATWYTNGFINYLSGAGGGGGSGGGGASGGSGSYGIYIQANILKAPIISANGTDGVVNCNGGCGGGGGGGGGGVIMLAYNSLYSAGTYNTLGAPGSGGGGGYNGGAGGNGQLVTYQYTTQPISISCSNCYTAPTVTIGNPTNTIVDEGQWQSFTATITGGSSPFSYGFNAVNSASPGIIVNAIAVTGQSASTYTWVYFVGANDIANTPIEANVAITDSHPNSANSVYSATYSVHPALTGGMPTETNTAIVSDGYSRLTANPIGGSPGYTYQWYTISGSTAPTCTAANSISGATSSTYLASPTSTNSYAYQVTDSATTNEIGCSTGNTVVVDAALITPTITSNVIGNTIVPFNVLLSAYEPDGVPPLTYNFIIYNANTNIEVANAITSANTATISIPSGEGGNTLIANVFVTDSESTPVTVNSITTATMRVYNPISVLLTFDGGNVITESTTTTANIVISGGTGSYTASLTINNNPVTLSQLSATAFSYTQVQPITAYYTYKATITDEGVSGYQTTVTNVLVVNNPPTSPGSTSGGPGPSSISPLPTTTAAPFTAPTPPPTVAPNVPILVKIETWVSYLITTFANGGLQPFWFIPNTNIPLLQAMQHWQLPVAITLIVILTLLDIAAWIKRWGRVFKWTTGLLVAALIFFAAGKVIS